MVFDTKMFGEDSKYTTLVNEHPENLIKDYIQAVGKLNKPIAQGSEQEKDEVKKRKQIAFRRIH